MKDLDNCEKLALWSTLNAMLHAYGHKRSELTAPKGPISNDVDRVKDVRVWWQRYQSELELERAYSRTIAEGRVWD